MTRCDSFEADLVDLASDELEPARLAALEVHLAGCAACRRELASLRDLEGSLERTAQRPEELSLVGFPRRAAERAELFRDRSIRGAWWSLRPAPRLALALSGAALAGAVALVFLHEPPEHASPADPPALQASHDTGVEGLDTTVDPSLDSALDALDDDELEAFASALDYVQFVDPS